MSNVCIIHIHIYSYRPYVHQSVYIQFYVCKCIYIVYKFEEHIYLYAFSLVLVCDT